ncbi:serine protease [Actinoplanes sp. NBC_00393]|uniref:hypothetical protein n=1 Tax=Actinoplanes sp. NBC_00393 TaxID=2975953 RepID=UPI002E1FB49B
MELSYEGRVLGGGLLVQRGGVILTAAHCLRALPSEAKTLTATLACETEFEVRVDEVADWDLALLTAVDPGQCDYLPPQTDCCSPQDTWSAPYRPSLSDPHLDGVVIAGQCDYGLRDGTTITALELTVRQLLGDYSGYSGGPVEVEVGGQPRLVGILLEQYPDRSDATKASNVLFAAHIRHAILQFRRFDIGHLLPGGTPRSGPAAVSGSRPEVSPTAHAERRLKQVREWRETEVISPRAAEATELRILRMWLDAEPDGDTGA